MELAWGGVQRKATGKSSYLTAAAQTLVYAAIAMLIVSPWWQRNWLASGDPVWPYGYPIFHSRLGMVPFQGLLGFLARYADQLGLV